MKLTPEIPRQFITFHPPYPLLSAQQQRQHITQVWRSWIRETHPWHQPAL